MRKKVDNVDRFKDLLIRVCSEVGILDIPEFECSKTGDGGFYIEIEEKYLKMLSDKNPDGVEALRNFS